MAEYIIQDSTLQGIADAIRAKAGTSDPIATSAFAEAIAAIEAGGSDVKMTCGTFTPSSTITIGTDVTTGYAIEHGLGETPNLVVCAYGSSGGYREMGLRSFTLMRYNDYRGFRTVASHDNSSSGKVQFGGGNVTSIVDSTKFVISGLDEETTLLPIKYVWIAAIVSV